MCLKINQNELPDLFKLLPIHLLYYLKWANNYLYISSPLNNSLKELKFLNITTYISFISTNVE